MGVELIAKIRQAKITPKAQQSQGSPHLWEKDKLVRREPFEHFSTYKIRVILPGRVFFCYQHKFLAQSR